MEFITPGHRNPVVTKRNRPPRWYRILDQLDSQEQYYRAHHLDLVGMEPEALHIELHRTRCAIALSREDIHPWLVQREACIEAMLQQPQQDTPSEPTPTPPSAPKTPTVRTQVRRKL